MIGLLQSDIKTALKSAFANMDGPLSVIDWCRGRSNVSESAAMGDAYSFQYTPGDSRDTSSSIPIGGDAMSPAQSSSDRGISAAIYHGLYSTSPFHGTNMTLPEGASHDPFLRILNVNAGTSDLEHHKGYHRVRPTIAVLPSPSLLVG